MDNKFSIMIVDDEMIIRQSFLHWFKKDGHVVETAESGYEAMEKLEQSPFDVLFVDVKMPGMNGIELLEKVKEAYPETIVVIITAYGSIETAVQAMKLGAADYLLKPFKPEQLSLVMEKISQQKKMFSLRYMAFQNITILKVGWNNLPVLMILSANQNLCKIFLL